MLRTSDPTLSAEEVALGCRQLLQVERACRDMKTTLNLRPVYQRRQERIRAHVLPCGLGLLLIRIAENGTGQTWHRTCADGAGDQPGVSVEDLQRLVEHPALRHGVGTPTRPSGRAAPIREGDVIYLVLPD